jgi:hypothetical protein
MKRDFASSSLSSLAFFPNPTIRAAKSLSKKKPKVDIKGALSRQHAHIYSFTSLLIYFHSTMTEIALNHHGSFDGSFDMKNTTLINTRALPLIKLRKRTISNEQQEQTQTPVPSVNSAFLSGLFADVLLVAQEHATSSASQDEEAPPARPSKKSRVSSTSLSIGPISRSGKSFKNLHDELDPVPASPKGAADFFLETTASFGCKSSPSTEAFDPAATVQGHVVFPQLSATVSSSTCNTVPRNLSDLESSLLTMNNQKKKDAAAIYYGWFVEIEDGATTVPRETASPYSSLTNLAFSAPTNSPNAPDQEANDVEWAQAADTVDDVLGELLF